jgi:hypothetical protein
VSRARAELRALRVHVHVARLLAGNAVSCAHVDQRALRVHVHIARLRRQRRVVRSSRASRAARQRHTSCRALASGIACCSPGAYVVSCARVGHRAPRVHVTAPVARSRRGACVFISRVVFGRTHATESRRPTSGAHPMSARRARSRQRGTQAGRRPPLARRRTAVRTHRPVLRDRCPTEALAPSTCGGGAPAVSEGPRAAAPLPPVDSSLAPRSAPEARPSSRR